jgi:hypothetical protein
MIPRWLKRLFSRQKQTQKIIYGWVHREVPDGYTGPTERVELSRIQVNSRFAWCTFVERPPADAQNDGGQVTPTA